MPTFVGITRLFASGNNRIVSHCTFAQARLIDHHT